MAVIPPRDKRKDILKEKEEQVGSLERELSTAREKLSQTQTDLSRTQEDASQMRGELSKKQQEFAYAQQQLYELQKKVGGEKRASEPQIKITPDYSASGLKKSRRTFITKDMRNFLTVLLLGGSLTALGYSYTRLTNRSQTAQQSTMTSSTQPTTTTEQTTSATTTTSTTFEDPNTWPVRKTLSELRDALKIPGSKSIYNLPTANVYEMKQSTNPMALLPKGSSVEMRAEDYERLYAQGDLWYRNSEGGLMSVSELVSYHPKFALYYDRVFYHLNMQHFFRDSRGMNYNRVWEENIDRSYVPKMIFEMWDPGFPGNPPHAIRFKGGYGYSTYDKIFYEG